MREDVTSSQVILAVSTAIEAKFDRSDWVELSLRTDTRELIQNHPRLLRSLDWGDPDYRGHVMAVVPEVLGERKRGRKTTFENLTLVEEFLHLQSWLKDREPAMYFELYGGEEVHESATDDLQAAAGRLGLRDIDEQAARVRFGLQKDLPLAIGQAKELLETAYKAILGLHGAGKETKLDLPDLAKQVNVALGLDDQGARGDEPGAKQRRAILKGLNLIIQGIGEMRNAGFGTGHGIYERPELDVATARLAVTAAVAAATFYVEADAAIDEDLD